MIAPLISSEYIRELSNETLADKQTVFTRSPLILSSDYWNKNYSPYINPPNLDVRDEEVLKNNILKFKQDIRFAFHLKYEGFVVVRLSNQKPEKLGELIKEVIDSHENFTGQVLVEIPMVDLKTLGSAYCSDYGDDEEVTGQDQWKIWSRFHAATDFSGRIQVIKELLNLVFSLTSHIFLLAFACAGTRSTINQ